MIRFKTLRYIQSKLERNIVNTFYVKAHKHFLIEARNFTSIDVIIFTKMTSYFSLSGFYFITYRFCCGWRRCLKLNSINK